MSPTTPIPAHGSQVRLLKDVLIPGVGMKMLKDTVATVVRSPNRCMVGFCWVKGDATNHSTVTIRLLADEWEEIAPPTC